MNKRIFQSKSLRVWASLALAAGLLALSLVLMASLVSAQDGSINGPASNQAQMGQPASPEGDGMWTPLGGPITEGGQVNALAVHPTISGTVYAAVAPPGAYDSGPSVIYKTTDGAATWTPVYTAQHQVYSLGVTDTVVYAGAFNPGGEGANIYASHDSGATWTPVFTWTDRAVWLDVSVHPTDTDVAIIGGWAYHQVGPDRPQSGLVYRTDDAGLTWTPILTVTFPNAETSLLAALMHPVSPTLLVAAVQDPFSSDSFLYRSMDGGATWPISVTVPNAPIISLAANTTQPNILYAGAGFGPMTGGRAAVFRSTDAGLSWTEVHSDGTHLAFDSLHDRIYTIMDNGPVYVSSSAGDPGSWIGIGSIPDSAYSFDLDLGPAPIEIYAGSRQRGVFKGVLDGDRTWNPYNNGIENPLPPRDIDIDPLDLDKMFAATECSGGWLSTDGGWTWSEPSGIAGCMGAFAINPDDPDIVYGGSFDCSRGTVLRSEDGGLNFQPVFTPTFIISDCSGGDETIFDVAIAPSMTSTVYAAGADHPNWSGDQAVVVRSLDDGASWTVVFTLPEWSQIQVVTIDPTDDDVVYIGGEACDQFGCEGTIYRSIDGGDSWQPTLVSSHTIGSIAVDHQKPNVVYAATRGPYDVYKSIDGGGTWTLIRSNNPPFEEPSGYLLAIDPHVPSHVYLGGYGYIAETPDGGQTWSDWGDPINNGTPGMEPTALTVDNGTLTQTLYAGFSGVWAYSRWAPQEGPRYVATTGSDDANLCVDPAAPCRTIGHALDLVSSGESILIAKGTYTENLNIDGKTLTLRGGYTISGTEWLTDTGETIIDGNGADRTFLIHGNNSVLENLTITGGDTPDGECWGGGVWVTNGDVAIRDSLVTGNWADCSGAGIEVNSDWGPAHLTLVDSIVFDNQSGGDCGGVSVWHTGAHLTNTLIVSNTGSNGSAMRIEDADVTIQNCTVADNQGGAAINAYDTDGQPDALTLRNAIVWGNTDTNLACTVQTCTVTYSDVEGGWTGTGNINEYPLFVGGGDYHLQPDSLCIDAGTSTGAPDHDFEGDARPFAYGVDMGGDEWWPMLSVTLSADQAGEGPPGADVTYVFTVTNNGDYTDTFGLEVSGVWTPTLDAGITSPLASGGSSTVALTVTIPPDTVNGASDVATLTATSGWSTAISDSALATTTARWHRVYLPITLRNLGP